MLKISFPWLLASTVALGSRAPNVSVALFKVNYLLSKDAFKIFFFFLYFIWVLPSGNLWPRYFLILCQLLDVFEYVLSMVNLFSVGVSI